MSLSVLSLNILHDRGPWQQRARRIREWLDLLDPDLVGLQEVLRGEGRDQCAELFESRGYQLDFGRACAFWSDPSLDFGNAVASRWPIRVRQELALPESGDGETRSALNVSVEAPVGPISFTSTHLNWKFHHGHVRERQVVALCDFAMQLRPADGFPPILVGDFNAEPDSAEIRYIKGLQSLEGRSVYLRDAWEQAGDGGRGLTWSNRNPYARSWMEPERRIDYIFSGSPLFAGVGLVTKCQVVCHEPRDGVWPSDHFGVYAEFRSEPDPELAVDPHEG
jgi:endonuclease/exonuclease/phosphatase family metal-dependent hydrolase